MRVLCFLILLLVLAAVGIFVYQNDQAVTVRYLDRSETSSLPVLVGIVYLLGMVSGWTVVGFLKRTARRVTERENA